MTKIKICGITRLEEVEFINKLEPDYIGFVFAESRRKVNLEQSVILGRALKGSIKKVGVFVNADVEYVRKVVKEAGLDVIQLHGSENQQYIDNFRGTEIWKAINIISHDDIQKTREYTVQGFVFDSLVNGTRGGTGKCFDWNMIKGVNCSSKLILAGGLNGNNVRKAIEVAKPYIVDVSSGVEEGGIKKFELCRDFIEEVNRL